MEGIFLEVKRRAETGKNKVKYLRGKGFIPAVVYSEGKEALAIKVSHSALIKLVHQHRIEGVIINLNIEDDQKEKNRPCLIKEIQYDPVHGNIKHVDFNEVSLTKVIKINVPVAARGEPVGVKQEGGSLEQILWEIEIECLPTNIPESFEVDISNLKMNESVHVKDLAVPSGVKILSDLEAIVVQIAAPMKEEVVEEALEGQEPQEPEVIKEKKEIPAEEGQEEVKEEKKKEEKKKE